MLSFDRRRAIVALFGAVLVLPLGGCFRPLYGGVAGGELRATMAAIEVDTIPDRVGHYLRNDLMFELDGSGAATPKRYRLSVKLKQRLASPIVDTSTGRAQTGNLTTEAVFVLKPFDSDQPILQGTAVAFVTYDRSPQRFAALRAARDAEIRIAAQLAEQIRTRISAGLATRP